MHKINLDYCLKFGIKQLTNSSERPRLETEILLIHLLNITRTHFFTHLNIEVSESKFKEFEQILIKRSSGVPVEYLTNKVSFYSEDFFISEGALIPRPETEILIDKVIEIIKKNYNYAKNLTIVEIGVGSGIISIMLAKLLKNFQNIEFFALDISEEALRIAKINIKKFNLENKIKLLQSDLLDVFNLEQYKNQKIDILVSNPPYIANSEEKNLQQELSFEPHQALYGGIIGDEIIQKIILKTQEKNIDYFVCEMGFDQKNRIKEFLTKNNLNEKYSINFYKDLANLDRGFILNRIPYSIS
jgi:release factor glutamine methyltransferase